MNLDPQMNVLVYAIAKCRAENKIILGYLIGSLGENYPGFSAFLQKKMTREIALETDTQLQQMMSVLDMYDAQDGDAVSDTFSIDKLLKIFSGK
ncbi:MAG: hypothetical protein EOP56_06025 [Sphingobacteriales bacterium]|nr:MAG: hypothetical protein EOP56_06025 [Sphingobacteriales bacterium]